MDGIRRIRLDLEDATEPITGRLYPDEGVEHAFCGYLELLALLEGLRLPAAADGLGDNGQSPVRSGET